MSELCLHIGSSKTGSTSLQRTFFKSRDKLLKEGYFYSTSSVNNTFLYNAFNSKCASKVREDAREELGRSLTEFSQAGVDKAIMSSEYLSFLSERSVLDLHSVLKQCFDSIKVVCYVRHPVAHCASQIQQYVKRGIGSLDSFYKAPPYFSPSKVLPIFENVFGEHSVICRGFERELLIDGDVVKDFCNVVGLKSNVLNSVREDNVSLSYEYLIMADLLYKLKLSKEYSDLKNVLITDLFENTGQGQKFTLPQEVTSLVSKSCVPDLEYMKKEYNIEFLEPKWVLERKNPYVESDFISSVLQNAIKFCRAKELK